MHDSVAYALCNKATDSRSSWERGRRETVKVLVMVMAMAAAVDNGRSRSGAREGLYYKGQGSLSYKGMEAGVSLVPVPQQPGGSRGMYVRTYVLIGKLATGPLFLPPDGGTG